MAITLMTGEYASRYRCPECKTLVGVHQTTFGDPCPKCGFSASRRDAHWDWELSRWRLVLGWPMIQWDIREGGKRSEDDSW